MALKNYLADETQYPKKKNTNIVDLLKRSKLEEKKGKRQNIILIAAAVSALVVSGFIIYQ